MGFSVHQRTFFRAVIRHVKAFLNWLCAELFLCHWRIERRMQWKEVTRLRTNLTGRERRALGFCLLRPKRQKRNPLSCAFCRCCHFCCWTWSSTLLIIEIIMLMLTAPLAFLGSRCQRFSCEPRHSAKCQPSPGVCIYVCWRAMAWDKGELATSARRNTQTCTRTHTHAHLHTLIHTCRHQAQILIKVHCFSN